MPVLKKRINFKKQYESCMSNFLTQVNLTLTHVTPSFNKNRLNRVLLPEKVLDTESIKYKPISTYKVSC
jgi:hypothetical protein